MQNYSFISHPSTVPVPDEKLQPTRQIIARTKWSDENMCLSKILYKPTISSLPTAAAISQSRRDIGLLE